MKKLFIVLVLLLVGCQKEDIKIGYVNTLSGPFASIGIETMRGVEIAVDEINENGGVNGHKIDLIIKDDMADPEVALLVDQELLDEGVVAIIGHGLSKVADAVIPFANDNDILMISPTISTDKYTGKDDLFVRIIPGAETQGQALCSFAQDAGGSVTIVSEENNFAYTSAVKESFIACFGVNDVDSITFDSTDQLSFINMSEDIIRLNNDNVVLVASSRDVINLEFIFINNEFETNILLSTWGTTDDLLSLGDQQYNDIKGVGYYYLNSIDQKFIELKELYATTYGTPISFSVLFGYETATVLFDAMTRADNFGTSSIKEAMIDRNYQGVMHTFYIDQYGDAKRNVYKLKLEKGTYTTND